MGVTGIPGRRKPERLTRRALAAKHGVHMSAVTKWEHDGLPVAQRGGKGRPSLYDPRAVAAWLQAREEASKTGGHADLAQERARKERAQAILAEQTFAIRSGDYVPRRDVERAWAAEVAAIRTHLLAWPTTLADRVFRVATLEGLPGVERVLYEATREVLRELGAGVHGGAKAPEAEAVS